MNITRYKHTLIIIFFLLLALGGLSSLLYYTSPHRAIPLKRFQHEIAEHESKARDVLKDVRLLYAEDNIHVLANDYDFPREEISFYIVDDGELVFWSDNSLDIDNIYPYDFPEWQYIHLPNAHCIVVSETVDDVRYMAVVTVKYDYPYENDKLINCFTSGFKIDKRIELFYEEEPSLYPVYSQEGAYLFSFREPELPIYSTVWANLGAIIFFLVFVCSFVIYACFPMLQHKRKITFCTFIYSLGINGALLALLLYFDIPRILFQNDFFSPLQFASGPFFDTIAHLSIFTGFVLSSVCLFYFFVDLNWDKGKEIRNILMFLLYPVYFLLLYKVLKDIVFHSSLQLNILETNDLSFVPVWIHFLLFSWGIALTLLFFKLHTAFLQDNSLKKALFVDIAIYALVLLVSLFLFKEYIWNIALFYLLITACYYLSYVFPKVKKNSFLLALWCLLYTFFISMNILDITIKKNETRYYVLAQNVYVNGNIESDRVADLMFEELDMQLLEDARIINFLSRPEAVHDFEEYLNTTYFRGFWNKYNVQLSSALQSSDLYQDYLFYTEHVGAKIRGTHFYSVPTTQNAMTYVGVFPGSPLAGTNDSVYYYIEFYPRRQYKSYSFPDLLIPASTEDIHSQMDISVAKYDNGQLIYSSGAVDYPFNTTWITPMDSAYGRIKESGIWHYVYKPNEEIYIVISKDVPYAPYYYMRFFIYLALAYFILIWCLVRLYRFLYCRSNLKLGFAMRFQYVFIFLFIISFIAIFLASVDFIKLRYEDQQIAILENKRNYIQEALQDKYYWNQELDERNASALNDDLRELSYTYQTDIHVFDNRGLLLGSSQPLIFSRHLISDRMSSRPFFSVDPQIQQYEHIGDLTYLVAYADFYNWDYLQIGYIAVPQFFSQENMQEEIQNFSSVIIHIYVIVIFIAIVLAIFVSKRLAAPLNMLEHKLREMRIGRRNEKIEYRQNDEIGQLVAQYNRTVDELELSAKLLARSERESAWKLMARQVAHEINNPLTPMKLSIQQLQRRKNMDDDGFDDYFKESTAMLIEQIDSLSRIAGTFSNFARMPEANIQRVDISVILQSVIRLFINNSRKVSVVYDGPEKGYFIYADPEQLVQVFNNLIKNAIQAIPEGRKGLVTASLWQEDEKIIIYITDNGSGVPKEVQDKMFVPNFTTKATGMGLGLAITKNIIEQLGGSISFETVEGEGSTFKIEIPV